MSKGTFLIAVDRLMGNLNANRRLGHLSGKGAIAYCRFDPIQAYTDIITTTMPMGVKIQYRFNMVSIGFNKDHCNFLHGRPLRSHMP